MGRCQVACQSMEDDHLRNICSQPPRERSFSLFVVVSLLVVVSFIPFAHIFVGKIVHTTRLAALLSTSNVNSPPPSPISFPSLTLLYTTSYNLIALDLCDRQWDSDLMPTICAMRRHTQLNLPTACPTNTHSSPPKKPTSRYCSVRQLVVKSSPSSPRLRNLIIIIIISCMLSVLLCCLCVNVCAGEFSSTVAVVWPPPPRFIVLRTALFRVRFEVLMFCELLKRQWWVVLLLFCNLHPHTNMSDMLVLLFVFFSLSFLYVLTSYFRRVLVIYLQCTTL